MATLLHPYIHLFFAVEPSLFHAASLFSVFIASLVGSLHCIGMCGGFVVLAGAGSPRGIALGQLWYHIGRGAGYVALGGCVGGIGDIAIDFVRRVSYRTPWWVLGLVAAVSVVLVLRLRIRLRDRDRSRQSKFVGIANGERFGFMHRIGSMPFVLGFATPLLPCPWLYSFVAVAAIAGDVGRGAGIMFAFWLGTLPALLVVGTIFEAGLRRMLKKFPRLSLAALVLAALFSVTLHLLHGR
jgi:sulfite exporter TauE/SafE